MNRQQYANNDFLTKVFAVSMISFLILEAFLPKEDRYLAFLFLILEATMLWVLGIVQAGLGSVSTTARMLATYVALSALIVDETQAKR